MLAGFGEAYGLNRDLAVKLGRAFGSGMGLGRLCGAAVGAFLVLGLKVQEAENERATRYRTYDLVKEFLLRFEARHGASMCRELLGGVDLGTEAGRQEAMDRDLYRTVCPAFVRTAAEILLEL